MTIIQEKIITVFGSSRPREGDTDYAEARELGRELATNGLAVCTGGFSGVMEAVSRGAKEACGKTYGVTAEFFKGAKVNEWVDVEVRVKSWQERLFELIRLGDGYAVCKGGTGTLAELAVVWEMLNKSVMTGKPFVAVGDFWQPILERVRQVEMAHAGSWKEANTALVTRMDSPKAAAEYLAKKLLLKNYR